MYCSNCGKKIDSSDAAFCPFCGAPIPTKDSQGPTASMRAPQKPKNAWDPDPIPAGFGEEGRSAGSSYWDKEDTEYSRFREMDEREYLRNKYRERRRFGRKSFFQEDKDSLPLNIFSFLSPILGFILYMIWRDELPVRSAGIKAWAIAGGAVWVFFRLFGWMIFY